MENCFIVWFCLEIGIIGIIQHSENHFLDKKEPPAAKKFSHQLMGDTIFLPWFHGSATMVPIAG